jgi:hypothetical protein
LLFLLSALAASAADFHFDIPPVRTTLDIADQPVAVVISGRLDARGESSIAVSLDADLAGLQAQILPILRAQLNEDNRCGNRLSVEQAALAPEAPSAMLTAVVHFEKFACAKAFGKEMVKRLVGGNGTVRVRLTPVVDSPAGAHLNAEVLPIEADGQLGEILRSGQYGAALSEHIRKTLQSDLEKSTAFKGALPPSITNIAALRSAAFRDAAGRLVLTVSGEVQATADQINVIFKDPHR